MSPRLRSALALALAVIAMRGINAQDTVDARRGGVPPNDPGRRMPVIAGIAVLGNTVTQPDIILREMTLHPGDTVDTDELAYCQERIYSLGLFNRVTISYPPEDSTIILIDVDERWFYYPVPMVGVVDRDIHRWYYGIGFKHENVAGWNQKLFAGFVLGYNPWANIYYSNPWIFGSAQLFSTTSLTYQRVVNKSLVAQGLGPNFNEIRYSAAETIGKRFSTFHDAWITVSWNSVDVPDNRPGRTISQRGIDRYVSIGVFARHDTRDLREYTLQGFYGQAGVVKKGLGGGVDCFSASIDLRGYQLLPMGASIGGRVFARVQGGGVIPNYEHEYYGFLDRIRGHFFEEFEGESISGASAELRVPLIKPFYLRFGDIPVPQFATWRLGLYAALFADAGSTWYKNGRPYAGRVPAGGGAGLHFLFPYSVVVRLDRAWNEQGIGEWILDVGAAF